MRVFIVLIWCFWFVGVDAQNRSIVFREGNWEKILKQAKKEKKLIFVDCYTSWCGPCKMLAKNVFTQDKVADFYNTEFVCVKMDMEKGEGKDLQKRYGVSAFPTMFLLDGDGNVVYKILGGRDVRSFMESIKRGKEQEIPYYDAYSDIYPRDFPVLL